MEFHVQVHRDRDGCKRILFALFYKSTMFVVIVSAQNKRRVFTYLKYVLFYLYEHKLRMFKEQVSAPAPQSVLQ